MKVICEEYNIAITKNCSALFPFLKETQLRDRIFLECFFFFSWSTLLCLRLLINNTKANLHIIHKKSIRWTISFKRRPFNFSGVNISSKIHDLSCEWNIRAFLDKSMPRAEFFINSFLYFITCPSESESKWWDLAADTIKVGKGCDGIGSDD